MPIDKEADGNLIAPSETLRAESALPDAIFSDTPHCMDIGPFPIVGIGASAGGVEALQTLLKSFSTGQDIAYVVIMHLSPDHVSHLTEILEKSTTLPIKQIGQDMPIEPGHIYVLTPNHTLSLDGTWLRLQAMPVVRPFPKVIDHFFISLAEQLQEKAIGVVLSGTDHDGTIGIKAINAAGGMAMVQQPETAQHPGMPQSAIDTGLVDCILPIEEMYSKLVEYIDKATFWQKAHSSSKRLNETRALSKVLAAMSSQGRGDFRGYKEGMLMRRIARRMALLGIPNLKSYGALLKENSSEALSLEKDFLIKVTEFFREPPAWNALEQKVLPALLKSLTPNETLRIWAAGCATGEEAYSLAIAALEAMGRHELNFKLQVIGSDLDTEALETARAGTYPQSIAAVLNPALLSRYFTQSEGRFTVNQTLRKSVLFSQHNLLADPPYSRMHLISCRNLLIYIKPDVQQKLLKLFHFALKPEGFLFLGKSESAEPTEHFTEADKQHRIYQAVTLDNKKVISLPLLPDLLPTRPALQLAQTQQRPPTYADLVRDTLLRQHSTSAVLIDASSQVVYFYGSTIDFIAQPEGGATHDLMAMIRGELRVALHALIQTARSEHKPARILIAPIAQSERPIFVQAIPVEAVQSGFLLITFEYKAMRGEAGNGSSKSEEWARDMLEDDLHATRLDLDASILALEANNVELRIANEEARSLNEELQSANEELETSKEELQSINEELTTVNGDLEKSLKDLSLSNEDLDNLLASSGLPILFLDQKLRLKRFTSASTKLFSFIPSDVGRSIGDITSKLNSDDLMEVANTVQNSGSTIENEVHTSSGHFFLRRISAYRKESDHIEGVVVTYVPVDLLKAAQEEIRENERFRTLANSAPVWIWIGGIGGKLEFVNRRFLDETGLPVEDMMGTKWHSIIHSSDLKGYLDACSNAENHRGGYDLELRLRKVDGSYGWMRFVAEPRLAGNILIGYIGSGVDIQSHKDAELQLRNADQRKDEFLAILGHELRNPLSSIRNAAHVLQRAQPSDESPSKTAQVITRQVDHMARLVDDLLDSARLTRGILTLKKESVDMVLLVRSVIDSISELSGDIPQRQLDVVIENAPLFVDGDPLRLTQIVENLLTNAVKFTEAGGKITLDIRRKDCMLVLNIKDNGIGISSQMLPKIFGLFTQEEHAIRVASKGLGIGLSLVSQLTSLHGGSVTAKSNGIGHGSEFIVQLPLADIDSETLPESTASAPLQAGKERILVVDDNIESANAMAMIMNMYGYETRTTYDRESSLREAVSFIPNVALLDLSVPEPDGFELARKFQLMPETKETLLIACTGYGQPKDIEQTRKAGISHHLVKPIDPEDIHKLILAASKRN